MVVYTGRTVEQAIEKGLKDLNLSRMKAHIKVISREKKGFLGFGKKPARVSVDPISEKTAHKADQAAVKGVPEFVNQQNAPVTSPKEDAIALNKVSKLSKKADVENQKRDDVATETEPVVDEIANQPIVKPKAKVISLAEKREETQEYSKEEFVAVLSSDENEIQEPQLSTSESDTFEAFIASEFDSIESAEEQGENIQEATDDVLSYLEKIIYEMDVDASLDATNNRRNIVVQIETDQPGRVIGYHGKVLKSLQLLAQNYLHDHHSKRFSIVLNVRDYLEQRTETLTDLAEKAASRVLETGQEFVMDPMTNNERKIIHKTLSRIDGVTSYSEGDDPNRYIVIEPTQ